jgi:hypothetical protein
MCNKHCNTIQGHSANPSIKPNRRVYWYYSNCYNTICYHVYNKYFGGRTLALHKVTGVQVGYTLT